MLHGDNKLVYRIISSRRRGAMTLSPDCVLHVSCTSTPGILLQEKMTMVHVNIADSASAAAMDSWNAGG